MKKIIIIVALLVVCFSSIIFVNNYMTEKKNIAEYDGLIKELPSDYDSLPLFQQDGVYAFNPDDKEMMSGFSDYIAVAYLKEIKGTTYKNVRKVDGEISGTPYTCYDIEIVENIKGELKTDCTVPILHYGGVTIDGKSIEYITPILEQEKCYVLYLTVANDNNIYLNKSYVLPGINSKESCYKLLESENKNDILVECYNAYANEKLDFAPQLNYTTPYDSNFNDMD